MTVRSVARGAPAALARPACPRRVHSVMPNTLSDAALTVLDRFGEAALGCVRRRLEADPPASVREVHFAFPDYGGPEFLITEGINWRAAVARIWPSIQLLPETDALGELLFTEGVYHGEYRVVTDVVDEVRKDGEIRYRTIARPMYSVAKDFFQTNLYGLIVRYLETHGSAVYERV